jgi:hypothetical protein
LTGSRAKFEKVATAVKKKHGMDFPGIVLEWDEFLATAPQSDDVYEYVAKNPLYIPFKDELFGISPQDSRYADTFECSRWLHVQQEKDANAATALAKAEECEVWRSKPCMDKTANVAYERVKVDSLFVFFVFHLPFLYCFI